MNKWPWKNRKLTLRLKDGSTRTEEVGDEHKVKLSDELRRRGKASIPPVENSPSRLLSSG
jgi:hypothetical protein